MRDYEDLVGLEREIHELSEYYCKRSEAGASKEELLDIYFEIEELKERGRNAYDDDDDEYDCFY